MYYGANVFNNRLYSGLEERNMRSDSPR